MVDLFSNPYVADVSQFGADNNNVERYKQAAEYAADAKNAADAADKAIATTDALLKVAQDLVARVDVTEADVIKLRDDYNTQQQQLQTLTSQINGKINDIDTKIGEINTKLGEINKILNILQKLHVTVTTLPPGSNATGNYDSNTGEISLGIPEGDKGADGSVSDLSTVTQDVPTASDLGFFVKASDSTVHKALMSDIAKTFPSVTSISVTNKETGTTTKEPADAVITAAKLGLDDVPTNTQVLDKYKHPYKVYGTLTEAQADIANRNDGEMVVVWKGDSKLTLPSAPYTTHDIYKVTDAAGNRTLVLQESLNRIETINGQKPDSNGNINTAPPLGQPSLYIGEMLMFPYNPDAPYTDSSLVPADGSLIDRTSQPLLWQQIKSGKLPAVPDSEWLAGKKAVYSFGKKVAADGDDPANDGDDTTGVSFRVPDWTGGTAIRTPDKATEGAGNYDGEFYEQVPYITTVNGVAPADADGAITLAAADVHALPATGVAVSANKLNTPRKIAGHDFDGTADIDIIASDVSALADTVEAKDIKGADVDASGINTNIKKLTGLDGTLVLGSPGVTGNDAVGYDQMVSYVKTHGGGSAGADLTGVMTDFLGAIEWFPGFRPVSIPGYISADGQLLKRSDYPELWAAVDSGLFVTADESAWIGDVHQRGKYTKGTITSGGNANFRVPDLNGFRRQNDVLDGASSAFTGANSLQPFLRGNNTGASSVVGITVGMVQDDAIKDHTHTIPARYNVNTAQAATTDTNHVEYAATEATGGGNVTSGSSGNGNLETRPINVSGIWIIRAKSGFTAPNTSFNVITSDTAAPTAGVKYGGVVSSDYKANGKTYAAGQTRIVYNFGGKPSYEVLLVDGSGTTPSTVTWNFSSDGVLQGPNNKLKLGTSLTSTEINSSTGITFNNNARYHTWSYENNDPSKNGGAMAFKIDGPGAGTGDYSVDDFYVASSQYWARRFYVVNGDGTAQKSTTVFSARSDGAFTMDRPNQSWTIRADGNITGSAWSNSDLFGYLNTTFAPKSDLKFKTDIQENSKGAMDRINAIQTKEFTWKEDGRRDRGFIAQELKEIDSKYAYENAIDIECYSATAIIADLIDCVKELKAEITELKASK